MKVFYFGCWRASGHYIFEPGGHSPEPYKAGPWSARDLDADGYDEALYGRRATGTDGFCPPDPEQPQGVWRLVHRADGATMWTALGCWDRTQDQRLGSKAVFVAEGSHDEESMRALAAQQFPAVWARIEGAKR